jgi:hypothetical protein
MSRTDALTQTNGTQVILQIEGRNFGYDVLTVQFVTPEGMLLLGRRNWAAADQDDFTYPGGTHATSGTNHTTIFIALPPYFGAGLNVSVTVAGQSNDNSTAHFSYLPPNVGMVQGQPLAAADSLARRRLDQVVLAGHDWATQRTPCRFLSYNGTTEIGFTETVNLTAQGDFVKALDFYSVAPAFNATCVPANLLGTTVVQGTWTDVGEHTRFSCARRYKEEINSTIGACAFAAAALPHLTFPPRARLRAAARVPRGRVWRVPRVAAHGGVLFAPRVRLGGRPGRPP